MEYPSRSEQGIRLAAGNWSLEGLLRKIIECETALDEKTAVASGAGLDWERESLERSLRSYRATLENMIVPCRR